MKKDLDFTFLTEKQIFGSNNLEILRGNNYGVQATDFAILLGVELCPYKTNRNYCTWWTKSPLVTSVAVIDYKGYGDFRLAKNSNIGVRPVLSYSSISSLCVEKINRLSDWKIEFGEYPQNVVSEEIANELENIYLNGTIKETGKCYTTYLNVSEIIDIPSQLRTYTEYIYNKKKFIRFIGDSNCNGKELSDGRIVEEKKIYWVEVKPIEWIIDENANIAICKKIIFSGVRYCSNLRNIYNFKNTDIKKFMDTFLAKEIIPVESQNNKLTIDTNNKMIEEEKPKEYITSINVDEENEIHIKIKGNNEKIIKALKKLKEADVEVSLISTKSQEKSKSHYRVRK